MPATSNSVLTAVITGSHNFEVLEFIRLFRALPGVDFYPQTLENFSADLSNVRAKYETLVFYNMHSQLDPAIQKVYESLGESSQGIVLLHHGMLALRSWPLMAEISGVQVRDFKYFPGETVKIEIADPDHPITQGLGPWEMVDETYTMPNAGPENQVLLTTENPHSLETIAWTRLYKKSRVFVFASGHGKETYTDQNFQLVLRRGIEWTAGRI